MSNAPHNLVDAPAAKLPLGVQADGTITRKALPFAFIMGTIAVFAALPIGVLGVMLHNMGMERVRTEPEKARQLVAWSWGIFAVTDVIVIIVAVLVVALG